MLEDSVLYYSTNQSEKAPLELTTYLSCYDMVEKSQKSLSESQFAALSFAIWALNKDEPCDLQATLHLCHRGREMIHVRQEKSRLEIFFNKILRKYFASLKLIKNK